jgi:hypothetical protein
MQMANFDEVMKKGLNTIWIVVIFDRLFSQVTILFPLHNIY